jgi:hypothetical protein
MFSVNKFTFDFLGNFLTIGDILRFRTQETNLLQEVYNCNSIQLSFTASGHLRVTVSEKGNKRNIKYNININIKYNILWHKMKLKSKVKLSP